MRKISHDFMISKYLQVQDVMWSGIVQHREKFSGCKKESE